MAAPPNPLFATAAPVNCGENGAALDAVQTLPTDEAAVVAEITTEVESGTGAKGTPAWVVVPSTAMVSTDAVGL